MAVRYGKGLLEEALREAEDHVKKGLEGELRVFGRLEDMMPRDCILMAKPNIGRLEPDLLLIQPDGLFVVAEVKNVSIDSIRAIHPNGLMECRTYDMNPLEQVQAHREQLQRFVQAVSKKDVYRSIGHCVIFPSISQDEFKKKFRRDLNMWKNADTNNFLKHHLFMEDLQDAAKWTGCFKFSERPVRLHQADLHALVSKMKPRQQAGYVLKLQQAEAIRALTPLQPVFTAMEQVDDSETARIRETVQVLAEHAMGIAENAGNPMEGLLALKNLRMELAQEVHPLLNKANELTQMENKLITEGRRITEDFKKRTERRLSAVIDRRVYLMQREIEQTTKWHSTLVDSSKKASGAVLEGTRKLLAMNDRTKTAAEKLSDIDSRTAIEQLLEEHLSALFIRNATEKVIKQISGEFDEEWEKMIDEYSCYVDRFASGDRQTIQGSHLSAKHTVGASEQVLGLTLGSAVVGTVGLAAGWHTLTYAALNVFPPIAFFAAIATVTTGIVTKNHVIAGRKKEVRAAAESMYTHIMKELDPPRTVDRSSSLFAQVDAAGELYIKEAVRQGTEQLLGRLTLSHYQELIHAFQDFDALIGEAADELEQQMTATV